MASKTFAPYIGSRIRAARKQAGLSQKELADKLGVTPASISAWEKGKSCPSDKKLDEIKELFHLNNMLEDESNAWTPDFDILALDPEDDIAFFSLADTFPTLSKDSILTLLDIARMMERDNRYTKKQ